MLPIINYTLLLFLSLLILSSFRSTQHVILAFNPSFVREFRSSFYQISIREFPSISGIPWACAVARISLFPRELSPVILH